MDRKYNLKKWVAPNFVNLIENTDLHIQEIQWTLSRINTKKSTCRYIIAKRLKPKIKENLENREKWHITYKGSMLQIWLTYQKQRRPEDTGTIYSNTEGKPINQNPNIQINCLSKMRGKDISRKTKTKFVARRLTLKEVFGTKGTGRWWLRSTGRDEEH